MRRILALLFAALLGACTGAPSSDSGEGADRSRRPTGAPSQTASRSASGDGPVRIAVVGDMGTGDPSQHDMADRMCRVHDRVPFDVVVTTGDNVYDSGAPEDFDAKFFEPYRCLFERGATFRASFGNHDVMTETGKGMLAEEAFGMKDRFYSFRHGPVRFVVLDSTSLGAYQLTWLDRKLRRARGAPWLVAVLHHPPYSGGTRHGSDLTIRRKLARRFRKSGVDLVLSGHEHLYSRAKARGLTYVVTGGGGAGLYPCAAELPPGVRKCDSVHHFVLLKASEDSLRLSAIALDGRVVERLSIARRL